MNFARAMFVCSISGGTFLLGMISAAVLGVSVNDRSLDEHRAMKLFNFLTCESRPVQVRQGVCLRSTRSGVRIPLGAPKGTILELFWESLCQVCLSLPVSMSGGSKSQPTKS